MLSKPLAKTTSRLELYGPCALQKISVPISPPTDHNANRLGPDQVSADHVGRAQPGAGATVTPAISPAQVSPANASPAGCLSKR